LCAILIPGCRGGKMARRAFSHKELLPGLDVQRPNDSEGSWSGKQARCDDLRQRRHSRINNTSGS
jgi:hypothetical protein